MWFGVSIVILSHLRSLTAPQTQPLCDIHSLKAKFSVQLGIIVALQSHMCTRPVGVKNKILFYNRLNRTRIWVRQHLQMIAGMLFMSLLVSGACCFLLRPSNSFLLCVGGSCLKPNMLLRWALSWQRTSRAFQWCNMLDLDKFIIMAFRMASIICGTLKKRGKLKLNVST